MSHAEGQNDPAGAEDTGITSSKVFEAAGRTLAARSSSPAKRTADEMDGHGEPPRQGSLSKKDSFSNTDVDVTRFRRDRSGSVDMLAEDTDAQSKTSTSNTISSDSTRQSATSTSHTSIDSDSATARHETGARQSAKSAPPTPSLDEQVDRVTQIWMSLPDQEGKEGYVIATSWLNRVFARTKNGQTQLGGEVDKALLEGDIGPVDNRGLLPEGELDASLKDEHGKLFVPMRRGLKINEDFEVVPQEAWDLIVDWHGIAEGSPTIIRYMHNTAPEDAAQENFQFELYPPIFTIRKVTSQATPTEADMLAPRILASRSTLFQKFLRDLKQRLGIDINRKVQLWRVLEAQHTDTPAPTQNMPTGMLTPATSRSGSASPQRVELAHTTPKPKRVIEPSEFTSMIEGEQREMVDIRDETMNEKYNGHLQLDTVGLADDQVLIIEEQIGGPAGGEFMSANARKNTNKKGVSISITKAGDTKARTTDSGRSSPAPGPVTRGRARKDGRTRGTVGLTNLGNTCYMNSALQCIRSVEELTLYFLAEQYKRDLNTDNPLGYHGQIAKSYASLLASIYDTSGTTSFGPRAFKNTLGKCQPLFSGYGQQDSQEFLSFLVDGLHEDLNRVLKKPYIENPESDDNTVNDPEAIRELGEQFRKNHRMRNDSIATDLFNGFYKNTIICPICEKVSITFDPFSLLTLQLPIENTWQHEVFYFPLKGRPIQINADMDKNSTIRQLKEYVAKRAPGSKAERMMAAEVYNNKIYKMFKDRETLAELNIVPRDIVCVWELDAVPTNFPPPKKKESNNYSFYSSYRSMLPGSSDEDVPEFESPLADRMLVPLYSRVCEQNGQRFSRSVRSWPMYLVITREESKSYDAILRKVLKAIATLTTKPILEDMEDSGSEIEEGSSSDSNIKAQSVEGEDGLVDISMKSTSDADSSKEAEMLPPKPPPRKPQSPTAFDNSFIPPHLQNMFTMKYFAGAKEVVPTGFNNTLENKELPTIASRMPFRDSRRSSVQSDRSFRSASSRASVTSDTDDVPQLSADPADAVSEDEDATYISSMFTRPTNGTSRRPKKPITYSRKDRAKGAAGSRRASQQNEPDQPLIRLGEGLILDWEPEAYDALFEGSEGDNMRGRQTHLDMPVYHDPELEAKREKRMRRKKSGVSLEECFTESAKAETLTEDNAWYCNRCKERRLASKQLEIWTVPDILVIHLKRFTASRRLSDKIEVLVDFPIEGLDLNDRVGLTDGKDLTYDLFAVDNHYGGLGGGHYTAYAQNFYDKKWYSYNDSVVHQTSPESVITPAAYLLFYRRRSSTHLGPTYLQDLCARMLGETDSPEEPSPDSGEGLRLDGSSRSGLSSASAGAVQHLEVGAAAQHQADGGAGGRAGAIVPMSGALSLEQSEPPAYDEGVAMGLDVDDDYTNPQVGMVGPLNYAQTWGWEGLGQQGAAGGSDIDADAEEEQFDDAGSMNVRGMGNSDMDAEMEMENRILTDFGDDGDFTTGSLNAGRGTPIPSSSSPARPPMDMSDDGVIPDADEDGIDLGDATDNIRLATAALDARRERTLQVPVVMESLEHDDAPVAEVRVGDDADEDDLEVEERKV